MAVRAAGFPRVAAFTGGASLAPAVAGAIAAAIAGAATEHAEVLVPPVTAPAEAPVEATPAATPRSGARATGLVWSEASFWNPPGGVELYRSIYLRSGAAAP